MRCGKRSRVGLGPFSRGGGFLHSRGTQDEAVPTIWEKDGLMQESDCPMVTWLATLHVRCCDGSAEIASRETIGRDDNRAGLNLFTTSSSQNLRAAFRTRSSERWSLPQEPSPPHPASSLPPRRRCAPSATPPDRRRQPAGPCTSISSPSKILVASRTSATRRRASRFFPSSSFPNQLMKVTSQRNP